MLEETDSPFFYMKVIGLENLKSFNTKAPDSMIFLKLQATAKQIISDLVFYMLNVH